MPYSAIISQVLAGIQAAISAWPQVAAIITSAKAMITALFGSGAITQADQAALHSWVDAIAYMAQRGLTPPQWTVEADPGTVLPPPVSSSSSTTAAPAANAT